MWNHTSAEEHCDDSSPRARAGHCAVAVSSLSLVTMCIFSLTVYRLILVSMFGVAVMDIGKRGTIR